MVKYGEMTLRRKNIFGKFKGSFSLGARNADANHFGSASINVSTHFILLSDHKPCTACFYKVQQQIYNSFSRWLFHFYITVFVIFNFLRDVLGHLAFAVKYGYIKALAKIFGNLYDALQRLSSNWIIYAEVKLFRLQMGSKISAHYLF